MDQPGTDRPRTMVVAACATAALLALVAGAVTPVMAYDSPRFNDDDSTLVGLVRESLLDPTPAALLFAGLVVGALLALVGLVIRAWSPRRGRL